MSTPARRHDAGDIPTGCSPGNSADLVRHRWITSSPGLRDPVDIRPVGIGPQLDRARSRTIVARY